MEYGLWYPEGQDFTLKVFTDADWAGSVDDQKSTSGATFFLGNCLVSWSSKKTTLQFTLYNKRIIYCCRIMPHSGYLDQTNLRISTCKI